jgi:hypothetical protein
MNIEDKYKEYIENIDLSNLNFITAEAYQQLSHEEQFAEQMKWMNEFAEKKAKDKAFDILKENIVRLLIVERPLYKNSILLTYTCGKQEVFDDAEEIANRFNVSVQKVKNYAFYKRKLENVQFEKVHQRLFGNEYRIVGHNDK